MSDTTEAVAKALAWRWMKEGGEASSWIEEAEAIASLETVEEIAYALCHRGGNCFNIKTDTDMCPNREACAYAEDYMDHARLALAVRRIEAARAS
jgi:hypothetical protein